MKMPKFLHCKIKRYLTLAGSREYNCTSIHNTIFGFHSTPQILNIEASGQINISMPPLNDSSRNHRKIGDGVLAQVLIKTKPSAMPDRSIRILTLKTINVKKKATPLHYPPSKSGRLPLRENGRLPCVKMFAVRFSSGARQTSTLLCVFRMTHVKQKRTVSIYFPCIFKGAHDNHKSLLCVFLGTHGNSSTGVKLCCAP
jgi:hypothetical protein